MTRISFFNVMHQPTKSPFFGASKPLAPRLLTQVLFLPQIPISVSAAYTRYCIKNYGDKDIHYAVVGPPGTGKTHLRRNLDQLLNVDGNVLIDGFASSDALDVHWSSGHLSDDYVAELRAKRDNGDILPDDAIRSALDYMFSSIGSSPRILALDGIIRTRKQIKMAYDYAFVHGCNLGCVELSASAEECKRRMQVRPGAEQRADTKKAGERIDNFFHRTKPALKLVRADLGPNHVRVNTEKHHAMRTCQLVMQHICHLVSQKIDPKVVLAELIRRCQADRVVVA